MTSEPFEDHGPGPLWLIRGDAGDEAGDQASARGGRPLVCELVDRAALAELLLRERRPARVLGALAASMRLTEEDAAAWVAFLVALHGLGKASPGYQARDPWAALRLRAAGFRVAPPPDDRDGEHATVTAREVRRVLRERFGLGPFLAARLGYVVAGGDGDDRDAEPPSTGQGAPEWGLARDVLVAHLARFTGVTRLAPPSEELADDDASFLALEGLVAETTDVVRERSKRAPTATPRSVDAYAPVARARARDALAALRRGDLR